MGRYHHVYIKEFIDRNSEACDVQQTNILSQIGLVSKKFDHHLNNKDSVDPPLISSPFDVFLTIMATLIPVVEVRKGKQLSDIYLPL